MERNDSHTRRNGANARQSDVSHQYQSKLEFGIIILGNSGVGKSFLCNILIGQDQFTHEFSPSSVTSVTESVQINCGQYTPTIFNIPGLIEADQQRIEINKEEIKKAFKQSPLSIVLFVFGNQQGRIRDEDVVAFNALHHAYGFESKSLLLVVNGLPKERPPSYDAKATVQLKSVLKMETTDGMFCYLPQIEKGNKSDQQFLRECLLQKIVQMIPKGHKLNNEIVLLVDEIRVAKEEIRKQLEDFERLKTNFEAQIKNLEVEIERERKARMHEAMILKEISELKLQLARQQHEPPCCIL